MQMRHSTWVRRTKVGIYNTWALTRIKLQVVNMDLDKEK